MKPVHVIQFPTDEADVPDLGGKARALRVLSRAGLPVPDWFVVRGMAFLESLGETGKLQLLNARDAADVESLIQNLKPGPDVTKELHEGLARLCPVGGLFAVRSSASDEDGAEHSFAGQLESFLFVIPEHVGEKVAEVWRSGFSGRILDYRKQNRLTFVPQPPAVIIQRMVNADAAGVAFSADPVSGQRDVVVVSAVLGLGLALVSGEADADTWRVDRTGKILEQRVAEKKFAHCAAPESAEGVRREEILSELANRPALKEEQVRAVAELARRCAEHFGRPQDIEWAFENGRLFLLQSRPITSLAGMSNPDGTLNIWDNSNIAESYGGVTTPLTYTFARRAYEEVYRQFCHLMSVPSARIEANASVFHCMIGLIQGRVYYNLLNWYRVLAMLPGYAMNRRFMEQMMGVKEPLPDELVRAIGKASTAARVKDGLAFVRSLAGLVINHWTLASRIRKFYARLNDALRPPDPPLERARLDELAAVYQKLECQLLTRWDAPLVNDFFAMIFYGVLRKLTANWCGDTAGTLQNDLLCGEGGMVSAEPAQRVQQLAALAARQPEFVQKLCAAPIAEIERELGRVPDFAAAYQAYLAKFGDRCLDELKLESATLHDDPTTLLRSIGHLAQRAPLSKSTSGTGIETQLRSRAEARVVESLRGRPLRRLIFDWVLRNTRARVRDRENLRFERTRLFGRVRRIFVAAGIEFHARGLLESPGDIFHLELEEFLGYCAGTAASRDLKALTALRRAEFARYREMAPPPDRFETRGPVGEIKTFYARTQAGTASAVDGEWQGTGCCPGIVRGPVRVIVDPRNAMLKAGEILVAERTDPGWIMLFASAAGLLVERGSLLSHSAIVSREMGIPSIVSIPKITRELADGHWVEMNGSTGTIKRIQHD